MRIITISREFGSGGREFGKHLRLKSHGWQNFLIAFRRMLVSTNYEQSSKVNLLLQQKKVIEDNIFVCAGTEAKIKRCMEYAHDGENLTPKELTRKIKQIDKIRSQTREILSGSSWGQREAYHLIINTSSWDIEVLATAIADLANSWCIRRA